MSGTRNPLFSKRIKNIFTKSLDIEHTSTETGEQIRISEKPTLTNRERMRARRAAASRKSRIRSRNPDKPVKKPKMTKSTLTEQNPKEMALTEPFLSTVTETGTRHYLGLDRSHTVKEPVEGDRFSHILTGETFQYRVGEWVADPEYAPKETIIDHDIKNPLSATKEINTLLKSTKHRIGDLVSVKDTGRQYLFQDNQWKYLPNKYLNQVIQELQQQVERLQTKIVDDTPRTEEMVATIHQMSEKIESLTNQVTKISIQLAYQKKGSQQSSKSPSHTVLDSSPERIVIKATPRKNLSPNGVATDE